MHINIIILYVYVYEIYVYMTVLEPTVDEPEENRKPEPQQVASVRWYGKYYNMYKKNSDGRAYGKPAA